MFHTRHSALRQGHQAPWYLVGTTISCALATCVAIGYLLQFHRQRLLCVKSDSTTPESNQAPQVSPLTHVPEYTAVYMKQGQRCESYILKPPTTYYRLIKHTDEFRNGKRLRTILLSTYHARPYDTPLHWNSPMSAVYSRQEASDCAS